MSGNTVDTILHKLRKHPQVKNEDSADDVVATFVVAKLSWRGIYRRILAVSKNAIATYHPETMSVTNTWSLGSDLAGIEVGGVHGQDGDVVVFRFRKGGGSPKEVKFACHERAALLESIYSVGYILSHTVGGSLEFLPPPRDCKAYKFKKGEWVPVVLRLTAVGVDRLDMRSHQVRWHWRFCYIDAAASLKVLSSKEAPPGHQAFAFSTVTGSMPKIYAIKERGSFLKAVQAAASQSIGIEIGIDVSMESLTAPEIIGLLAKRQVEAASRPDEGPISEWDVLKINLDKIHEDSTGNENMRGNSPQGSALVGRKITITRKSMLERRSDTYAMVEWKHLSSIAALVRYIDEPQWLGIEWSDGAVKDMYITSSRDGMLSSLLYAAQAAAGRPIEVLSSVTHRGDILVHKNQSSRGPSTKLDNVVESICLQRLHESCRKFLEAKGDELSLSALAFTGLAMSMDSAAEAGSNMNDPNSYFIGALEHQIRSFNASIPYKGVSEDSIIDSIAVRSLSCFVPNRVGSNRPLILAREEEKLVVVALQALQRISTSNTVRAYMLGAGGASGKIYSALSSTSDHVSLEAARLLLRLFAWSSVTNGRPAWIDDSEDSMDAMQRHNALAASRMAKAVCFISDSRCASIIEPLRSRVNVSPLLSTVIVELIVSIACFPGAETTDITTRENMIQQISGLGRKMFRLFDDHSLPSAEGLAVIMKTLAEGGTKAANPMRQAAIQEGALLKHLLKAVESLKGIDDGRMTSRELVAIWCDAYPPALELLKRIFPPGLTSILERSGGSIKRVNLKSSVLQEDKESPMPEIIIANEVQEEASGNIKDIYIAGKPRQSGVCHLQYNWPEFWFQVDHDHHHAGLIWNESCRHELRETLKSEENLLRVGRQKLLEEKSEPPSWNSGDFQVLYPSLLSQMEVGGMYIKLMAESQDSEPVENIQNPREFFMAAYLAFLKDANTSFQSKSNDMYGGTVFQRQSLCLKAMAMVYERFASSIGPFLEIEHILQVFDGTSSKTLRYFSLELIKSLIDPSYSDEDELVRKIAKQNSTNLVRHGVIQMLCDASATLHEMRLNSPSNTIDTKLISHFQDTNKAKVWYFINPESLDADIDVLELKEFASRKQGPISKVEVGNMFRQGKISPSTLMHRIGMKKPQMFWDIRELRWWCAEGGVLASEKNIPRRALEVLIQIVVLNPAKDPITHSSILPLPKAHRYLSSRVCMSRIAQLVLTNDPMAVPLASKLLRLITTQNAEAMSQLYSTGIFFFVLLFSGSNLTEISKLLRVSHLKQRFRGANSDSRGTLASNSVLGDFLPESLLYILESYGPDAFSAAFTGDSETPEVIWTNDMRSQRLMPHIWSHIGDFAGLLHESWGVTYEYVPCPPIIYPEIQKEIWCHRYYLRHLCNTSKYPNWEIVDHVKFLQAILGAWRTELARETSKGMTIAKAAEVLELDPQADLTEADFKKSFRRLARKYHPDRNPAGREKFERIHEAYQRLHSAKDEVCGPRRWCILLFIDSQCLLYARYSSLLCEFKYAGYPQLLSTISSQEQNDQNQHIMSADFTPLLQSVLKLCWLTCKSSDLNAEELMRSGGVSLLSSLCSRCVSVISKTAPPSDQLAIIISTIMHTFASMANFRSAREEIEKYNQLLVDAVTCCCLEKAYNAAHSSMKFVYSASANPVLCDRFILYGVLGALIPRMFSYDESLNSSQEKSEDSFRFLGNSNGDFFNQQASLNAIAVESVRVLSKLLSDSPKNEVSEKGCSEDAMDASGLGIAAMKALLTPSITNLIRKGEPDVSLQTLNGSIQSPIVFWIPCMTNQVLEFVKETGELRGEKSLRDAALFRHKNLVGEPYIAGVYARIFVSSRNLSGIDEIGFCKDLVKSLHRLEHITELDLVNGRVNCFQGSSVVEYPDDILECQTGEAFDDMRARNVLICLQALNSLLDCSPKLLGLLSTTASMEPLETILLPGASLGNQGQYWPCVSNWNEEVPINSFFMRNTDLVQATELCLSVFRKLASNSKCLHAMATISRLTLLCWMIHRPASKDVLTLSCEIFNMLSGEDKTSYFCAETGGTIFLLHFALETLPADTNEGVRQIVLPLKEMAIQSICKVCSNPLYGQKCILSLRSLIPTGLLIKMLEDDPQTALLAFKSECKTPEIIWDENMLSTLVGELRSLTEKARCSQESSWGTGFEWKPGDGYTVKYNNLEAATMIDNVYLDMFLENPGYHVRNPQKFLQGLVSTYVDICKTDGNSMLMEKLTKSALIMLENYPSLSGTMVAAGFIPKLLQVLKESLDRQVRILESTGQKQQNDAIESQTSLTVLTSIKLVHALCVSDVAAEAAAHSVPPAIPILMGSLKSHTKIMMLALETLKRLLQEHVRTRDLFVTSILDIGMVPVLLDILDWKERDDGNDGRNADEIAVTRVLCIDVVNLLTVDGTHSQQINALLSKSAVWEAYKGQKHDLFLPSFINQGKSLVGLLEKPTEHLLIGTSAAGFDHEDNEEPVGNEAIGKEFDCGDTSIQSPDKENLLSETYEEAEAGAFSKSVVGQDIIPGGEDSISMQASVEISSESGLEFKPMDTHGDPVIDSPSAEHGQHSELDQVTSLSPSKAIDDPLSQL
eukprot:jgi/Picsp_1/2367/NSC_05830-R1_dnaj homolog subfamily c member 13